MADHGQKSDQTACGVMQPRASLGSSDSPDHATEPGGASPAVRLDAPACLREAIRAAKLAASLFWNFLQFQARRSGRSAANALKGLHRPWGSVVGVRRNGSFSLYRLSIRSQIKRVDPKLRIRTAGRRIAISALVILTMIIAYAGYALWTISDDGGLEAQSQGAISFNAGDGKLFATRGIYKGEELTVADLPQVLTQATIAIEDRRFYQHFGIDLRGIVRAAFRNFGAGAPREGGSTITQQLARLTYLSPERSCDAKSKKRYSHFG